MPPPAFDFGAELGSAAWALEHRAWLRRLAQGLVRDPDAAEDLLQDTLVRALERPPADRTRSARPWLATVLRNLARTRWRQREERRSVERPLEEEGPAPSTEQLFGLQREVLNAVDGLRPHEREVVLLRYFEELPPREIAARLGVPVKTVDSRLHRALGRLREKLDDSHGDRRSWVLGFAPLLGARPLAPRVPSGGPSGAPSGLTQLLTASAVVMSTKLLLAGTAGLVVIALFVDWDSFRGGATPPRTLLGTTAEPVVLASSPETEVDVALAPRAQSARTAAPDVEVAAAPAEPALALVHGRAFLADGSPAADLRVRFDPRRSDEDELRAVTDLGGAFALPLSGSGSIHVDDTDFAELIVPTAVPAAESDTTPILVVAHNRPLAGRFVDPSGAAVGGVGIRLELPQEFHARLDVVIESNEFTRFSSSSGDDGRFHIDPRPLVADALLEVRHPDYEPQTLTPPQAALEDWEIELVPRTSSTGTLEGGVFDVAGEPVSGARLALGDSLTTSDEQGHFLFRLDEVEQPHRLMAVKPGFAPAVVHGTETGDGWLWPDYVDVVLEGEPAAIEGVVLDADGEPVPAANVWIEDPTHLGVSGTFPVEVERTLLGESVLWVRATADDSGRFRYGGLLERPYTLRAGIPGTAEITDTVVAAPGEEAVLRFVSGTVCERLEGLVVDRTGAPVADAHVSVDRIAHMVSDTEGMRYVSQLRGGATRTDEEGRFLLERVPREGCELHVRGSDVVELDLPLELALDPEPLVLVVDRECSLRIELSTPGLDVDTVRLLDDLGEPVIAQRYVHDAVYMAYDIPLPEGRQTLKVSESATTAVFLRDDEEVLRLPVALQPGEVTYLRP